MIAFCGAKDVPTMVDFFLIWRREMCKVTFVSQGKSEVKELKS